jgi:tetratricopeptide (TPR) repeat protein
LLKADRLVEAEAEFREALRLIPQYGYTRVYLGMASAARGDPERAIAEFNAALRLRPRFTVARVRLAMAYEQQGRFDGALAEYDRALRIDPDAVTALVRSAAILERRGQWDDAVARYRRALAVDADQDETRIALGAALLAKARWAEARDIFATFRTRHPDSYAARFYIGLTYARQGQDDRAWAEWRDAVRLNPEDPDLLVELGLLFARRGEWSAAVRWFDQALSLDSGRVSAHLNLASAAEQLGDVRRARAHYRAVADAPAGTADEARAQARAALGRLGRNVERSGAAGAGGDR